MTRSPTLAALVTGLSLAPLAGAPLPAVQVLLSVLIIAMHRPDLFASAKPLPLFIGAPGSGKTFAAKTIGRLIEGTGFTPLSIPPAVKDAWVAVNSGTVIVLDNIEGAPNWFADFLAQATSGGAHRARQLYSDTDTVTLSLRGFIIVTTFSGAINRGDLLDRALIFRFAAPQARMLEGAAFAWIEVNRAGLQAEITWALDELGKRIQAGTPQHAPEGTGRLADFFVFGSMIADILGGPEAAQLFQTALAAMREERLAVARDADPILSALVEFAHDPICAQWLTATDLLCHLARIMGAQRAFRAQLTDAAKFGTMLQRLRIQAAGVLQIDVKKVHGANMYRVGYIGPSFPNVPQTMPPNGR